MHIGISKQVTVRDSVRSYNFEPGDTYCGDRDWGNCQRCRLHHTRHRVAIKRTGGTGHARLLFIGEAPGELENKTGYPFVGIAGKILDQLFKLVHFQFQYCITNTVGCRPVDVLFMDSSYDEKYDETFSLSDYILDTDYELYNWNREPTEAEMEICRPHIDELITSFQPHGVVYLGKVAESYVTRLPTLALYHPAYIARLEYKLLPLRKEARKLDHFIERFLQT